MPDHGTMIAEILEVASDALNEWECQFMENIQEWNGPLRDRQIETLERIYAKVCAGPY